MGGVVTTGELVDLTILLRPAAETIDTSRQQRLKPSYLRPCERNLLHRFPELERVSFDDLLFEQLRTKSEEYEFPWSDLYEADSEGPAIGKSGTDDWANLLHLMSEVAPNIETELMNSERPLLLVHPGLIARYQMMSVLQTLRDRVGRCPPAPGVVVGAMC